MVMYFANGYRYEFLNVEGVLCTVSIYDRNTQQNDPIDTNFISLGTKVPDPPIEISCETRSEDKFEPIKPLKAIIRFFATANINASTFAQGEDNRWYTVIKIGSTTAFIGHLLQDNLREPFLPPTINTVTLTAVDGLAALNKKPLTKLDGTNPRGHFSLIEYIYLSLEGTGLRLPIYCVNNVRQSFSTKQFYRDAYLNAKSFEKDINKSTWAYEVLEKIFNNNCYVTQRDGAWWIIRVDELENSVQKVSVYVNGKYQKSIEVYLQKYIGFNEQMFLSEEATQVGYLRQVQYAALEYVYEYPKEIVDNIDFERGNWISIMDETFVDPDDGLTKVRKYYTLDDWDYANHKVNGTSTPATGFVRIQRTFFEDYERERVIIISGAAVQDYVKSSPVPVAIKDKVVISIDFRWKTSFNELSEPIMSVLLYAEDGTIWFLLKTGEWIMTPSSNIVPPAMSFTFLSREEDKAKVNSFSVESKELPRGGNIFIYLLNFRDYDMYLSNLQLVYRPFINGSYQKYKAHEHRVTQGGNYKYIEEKVGIADSPKKLFKGALLKRLIIGNIEFNVFSLATRFYDGAKFPTIPADINIHPYTHIQTFDVWNQNNRQFRLFEVQVKGTNSTSEVISVVNKFLITDSTTNTANKIFMLLHYSMDIKNCSWKGVLAEVFDTTIPKDYASEKTFKYITDR